MAYRTDMPAIATTPAPPTAVPAGRVLVVDDEPEVANFVARALRRRGFAVDLALSGERTSTGCATSSAGA
jgi:CheY-like chemotaxis protein